MPNELGPHLLGWRRRKPDARDFGIDDLKRIADPPDSIADMTLRQLYDQTPYVSSWWGVLVLWRWIKAFFDSPTPAPTPTPTPAVTPGFGEWTDATVLDQGDTGHCVGFAGCDWGNATPVTDTFADADGHALYYECKVIDGEPRAENGSDSRSLAKALQNRGRLAAYAFADTSKGVDDVNEWLDNHGPVITGTNWHRQMFYPDADGRITIEGPVDGGHEWLILDRDPATRMYECLNSWGDWAKGGKFYISEEDYHTLLVDEDGDALLGLELPR